MADGQAIAAAETLGCDLAYMASISASENTLAFLAGAFLALVVVGMKQKVGGDGELEVERGLLKDDTESRQRRDRVARHVMAHHLDAPGIGREQAGEQLEQCRLAGAIGTEQGDEFSGPGLEAHAIDGANRPVALDDIVQQQSWSGW